MTVNMKCDQVNDFKSQLTYTLDYWSRAVSIIDSIAPNIDQDRLVSGDTLLKCCFIINFACLRKKY